MVIPPRLSVIVASYNSRSTIPDSLESLRLQKTGWPFEVIVVDSSGDGTPEVVQADFPEVDLRHFPQRKFCGDARNVGLAVSRGDIVAFLDADCVASEDWVERVVGAHERPELAIGGAIGNGGPESLVSWAAYFCEFSPWLPGKAREWSKDMAGANVSYKRSAFQRFGPLIEGTYCSDTEFHWRLAEGGHRLRFDPSVLVFHRNIQDLGGFLRHEFHHGRSFARVRVGSGRISGLRRYGYAVGFGLIALVLLCRIVRNCWEGRQYRAPLLKSMPLLAVGVFAWSLGEMAGYVGGKMHWKRGGGQG